ncbi:2TM domain-containing protein [Aquimarina amphilecti]|uniref:2TM domain-containing protein n=1 Tax=Aquimarina amphilecti TaxID=1038014 RepID=A0A1H7PZX4_AQUAM|nr:2TM domain-containing protein [Aquimarina amphilecti]SEL41018.1 2TM domain-containing protein [Aquimarina amphilecti]
MENSELQKKYRNAKKRVQEEQSFYTHLSIYIVINIAIIIVILQLKDYFYDGYLIPNLISSPLLWGIFLLGHGLWTFRKKNGLGQLFKKSIFSKKWEEKKIKELINNNKNL